MQNKLKPLLPFDRFDIAIQDGKIFNGFHLKYFRPDNQQTILIPRNGKCRDQFCILIVAEV
jgi:hypothetical protein